MIIGISGKIGSGKDTIGKIIQYLIWKNKVEKGEISLANYTLDDFENLGSQLSNFQIKKFADKLKDIICLLINCTREQLEDRDFKEKELGEEWDKWEVYYVDHDGYSYTRYFITEDEKEIFINSISNDCYALKVSRIKLTPRLLMQILGTECGRDIIHPNIWVNSLMSEYKNLNEFPVFNEGKIIKEKEHKIYPNWIITDMRFSNELNSIKKKNGLIIRVNRNCEKCNQIGFHKMSCPIIKNGEHYSEKGLDDYQNWDYIINNKTTIDDLITKVKNILIKEKII